MSKNCFVSSSFSEGIHNDNANGLTHYQPPPPTTPHSTSMDTQLRRRQSSQDSLLSSLSLLADSAPSTKELRTALKESFAMVHMMVDEYIQMTKEHEYWWKAQLQQERTMQMVQEESLQTIVREDDVLERELRTRSRRVFVCPSYEKRHRRNVSWVCEVLAKWDDAHDMKRFAMYAAKLDSLYGIE